MLKTFMPNGQDTATIAATIASARVALDPYSNAVRIINKGAEDAFIQFGDENVTATTAKMPITSGATETFTKGSATHMAAVTASGTAILYVTSGEGM